MHLSLTNLKVCGRDEQCNHIRPVESRREAPSVLGQIFVPVGSASLSSATVAVVSLLHRRCTATNDEVEGYILRLSLMSRFYVSYS